MLEAHYQLINTRGLSSYSRDKTGHGQTKMEGGKVLYTSAPLIHPTGEA